MKQQTPEEGKPESVGNRRLFDFYLRMHEFEIERKERLSASVLGVAWLLAVAGGALGMILRDRGSDFTVPIGVLALLAAIFFLLGMAHIFAVWYRRETAYMPTAREVEEHYRDSGSDDEHWRALASMLVQASTLNAEINDRRATLLSWARLWAMVAVFIALVAVTVHLLTNEGTASQTSEGRIYNVHAEEVGQQ